MITDGIVLLWITINLADLQNLLVICLAKVKLDLKLDVVSVFACKIATINPVAIAKFFYIICKGALLSLFASRYCDKGLLEPVSIYFSKIEINGYSMLYLHCLV